MLLIEMDMPKNCIFCPMSHWNKLDEWTGCDAVGGKRFAATTDNEYSKMEGRPDWCPIQGEISDIELMHLEEERAFAARNIAAERKDNADN